MNVPVMDRMESKRQDRCNGSSLVSSVEEVRRRNPTL